MTKQEFLSALEQALSGLPKADIAERLDFYSEMIDDRMEEGLSEADAVSQIGSVDEIARQSIEDISLAKLVADRVKPKQPLSWWEIVLLILGAPLWLSLLAAAISVVIAVYAIMWSVVISLWAVEVSLWGTALGLLICGAAVFFLGNPAAGVMMLSGTLLCVGLSIFLFFGCTAMTKGIALLTKKVALWIKSRFIRKENVQ